MFLLLLTGGLSGSTRAFADIPAGYGVAFGTGQYISNRCVHQVPNGAHVTTDHQVFDSTGALVESVGPCSDPTIAIAPAAGDDVIFDTNGHVAEGYSYSATDPEYYGYNKLQVDYTVPPDGSYEPNVMSFWAGIYTYQDDLNEMLFQPLLLWGDTGTFGGDYWYVVTYVAQKVAGTWSVAWHSDPIEVSAGDSLISTVTASAENEYLVKIEDVTANVSWAGYWEYPTTQTPIEAETGVLETYGATLCNQFPSSNAMSFNVVTLCTASTASNWSDSTHCNAESAYGDTWTATDDNTGLNCGFGASNLVSGRNHYTGLSWTN